MRAPPKAKLRPPHHLPSGPCPGSPNAILPLTLAVARTQAGIVAREACDARRAAYEAEDGGFDAAPFDADLAGGRLKYLFSFLLFPGK